MQEAKRDVFFAIADSNRRQILRLLSDADQEELALHEITPHLDMGRTAVSKHLRILTDADLVEKQKVGKETRYHLTPKPLEEVKDWIAFYEDFWTKKIGDLKNLLEEE